VYWCRTYVIEKQWPPLKTGLRISKSGTVERIHRNRIRYDRFIIFTTKFPSNIRSIRTVQYDTRKSNDDGCSYKITVCFLQNVPVINITKRSKQNRKYVPRTKRNDSDTIRTVKTRSRDQIFDWKIPKPIACVRKYTRRTKKKPFFLSSRPSTSRTGVSKSCTTGSREYNLILT